MQAIERLEYIVEHTSKSNTNHQIAEIVYHNLWQIDKLSLQTISDLCSVSVSTFMRFLKYAGYSSYIALQSDVGTAISDFEYRSIFVPRHLNSEVHKTREELFLELLIKEIGQIRTEIDHDNLDRICEEIHGSRRVVMVSFISMTSLVASVLRASFALNEKETKMIALIMPDALDGFEPKEGDFYLFMMAESPLSKTLYAFLRKLQSVNNCRKLVISNVRNFTGRDLTDFALTFDGHQTYVDSYAMDTYLTLLAIRYRELYKNELFHPDD